ncbi:MAG: M15 family metallopeptidase, partial [Lachnospiraceae bacterium]|nr:M15 family metallopeptidase [Lachnospiraceae bacterium]
IVKKRYNLMEYVKKADRRAMEPSRHERILERLLGFSRRHPVFRGPVLAVVFVVLAIVHAGMLLKRKLPRAAALFSVCLAMVLCASFCWTEKQPVTEGGAGLPAIVKTDTEVYELYPAEEPSLSAAAGKNKAAAEKMYYGREDEAAGIAGEEMFFSDELLEELAGDAELTEAVAAAAEDPEESFRDEEAWLASFDADDWRILLVNKQHPIPEGYHFELAAFSGGLHCDSRVKEDLLAMLKAAADEDLHLYVCSPYRATETQVYSFNHKIKNNMAAGMSYAEAYRKASQAVTIPGCSEHEIGLAFDIVSDTYRALDFGFGKTGSGKWLAENCQRFGFILRYPADKEDITGIEYEPWHFRYVGVEAATYIMEHGLTLEEFTEALKDR